MTFGLVFWIIMLLWLFYGFWGWYKPHPEWQWGNALMLFVLFLLLGWKVFGAPIHP